MTDPNIIDVEIEEDVAPASPATPRPFLMVTHKSGMVGRFASFGAAQDLGGGVDRDTAENTVWWAPQDWLAQVLAAGVKLPQLLAPTPGFIAGLGLQRKIVHLRKRDVPGFYAKHPDLIQDHPEVVVSTGSEHSELKPPVWTGAYRLAKGEFPPPYDSLGPDVLLQLEEPTASVVEARYWITRGEVTAADAYRIGQIGWESPLFVEIMFNEQARELLTLADRFARDFAANHADYAPPGYAIDLGVSIDGVVSVVRAWPSWSADPLSADPTGVFRSILAAHDFDLDFADNDPWRWNPDPEIYDRSYLIEPTKEDTTDDDA